MVLVKILGALDIFTAVVFLTFAFGITPFIFLTLFCAVLLLIKGLFIFSGDILSLVDLGAALVLFLTLFFTPWIFLLWIPAFLLLAKGLVSFA